MNITDTLQVSLDSLKLHKLRSALTVLGIVIGIAAVIIVMSAGESIKDFVLGQIEAFGSDYIEVEVKTPAAAQASFENATSFVAGVNITTLKIKDAEEVAKHPNIKAYYAAMMGQEIISFGNDIKKTFLMGVTSDFLQIDKGKIAKGRFFTEAEDKSLSKVAIIGSKVKERLFGDSEVLGRNIKIKKNNYRVIGVMKERGAVAFFDMDNMVFVPLRTLQKRIMGIDHITFFMGKLKDTGLAGQTVRDVTEIMRRLHNISDPNKDDFAVISSEEAQNMVGVILGGISILLIALASISLIVGGVGIMNIMYVSVAERTYEIGLRKAVGATKADILRQFLGEAVIITFLGGILGIIVGIFSSFLISILAGSRGFEWNFSIPFTAIVLAGGVSVLIGIIFGIYPAKRAANLSVVEALRFE